MNSAKICASALPRRAALVSTRSITMFRGKASPTRPAKAVDPNAVLDDVELGARNWRSDEPIPNKPNQDIVRELKDVLGHEPVSSKSSSPTSETGGSRHNASPFNAAVAPGASDSTLNRLSNWVLYGESPTTLQPNFATVPRRFLHTPSNSTAADQVKQTAQDAKHKAQDLGNQAARSAERVKDDLSNTVNYATGSNLEGQARRVADDAKETSSVFSDKAGQAAEDVKQTAEKKAEQGREYAQDAAATAKGKAQELGDRAGQVYEKAKRTVADSTPNGTAATGVKSALDGLGQRTSEVLQQTKETVYEGVDAAKEKLGSLNDQLSQAYETAKDNVVGTAEDTKQALDREAERLKKEGTKLGQFAGKSRQTKPGDTYEMAKDDLVDPLIKNNGSSRK
ncbi:hypothetical protein IWQ60_003196 [Tieghemiomyces parasiticus]|uniref:Uncharacterized protein n=1 Tax=Tieghemiomyces parasiticus TaxID=78921 RepID=A0A9W8A9Z8_9FUNG|nr:hypothetical protein IWQ60_003196 [Tieghemiomyces parasiticus]